MIQETCVEIGELEEHWTAQREARTARRKRIRYIDELIEEFEKLNLAEEQEIPMELTGKVTTLIHEEAHPLARRLSHDVPIAEWMDALYDVQDTLMFGADDEND